MARGDAADPPVQQSLFPEAFEVQEAALAALRELDVARARNAFERARARNPDLVDAAVLDGALALLEELARAGPLGARLHLVVRAAHDACRSGRLPPAAAAFVDRTVARWWRRHGAGGPFLDAGETIHRGVLDLVLGDAAAARAHLSASLQEARHGWRADLWGYLGDANLLEQRPDEANACYVRGLLLGAAEVDLVRIRLPSLAELHAVLCREHGEDGARELLPVHAWLGGVLAIPPGNGWLDGRWARLLVRAAAGPDAAPRERWRRFALLLYLDRSAARGSVDLARREELAALDPVLFGRYMERCRAIEHGGGAVPAG